MRFIRKILCLVRRGHEWETTTDAAGSITFCSRCDALAHSRTLTIGAPSDTMAPS